MSSEDTTGYVAVTCNCLLRPAYTVFMSLTFCAIRCPKRKPGVFPPDVKTVLLVMVLLGLAGCAASPIEVVAIANEGFLIRSDRRTVLVDALFRATAPYPGFFSQGPSEDLVQQMVRGEGPFRQVDVALVTHADGDHFHAGTALEFLENHPETLLVGTTDVLEALAAVEGFGAFADRVVAPARTHGSCERLEHRGVGIIPCFAWHSGGREVANNIYIVEMDGFRFLHEGDADRSPATFSGLELPEEGLDLAFMHDWFVLNDGRDVVTDILRPRAVVLMHHRWERALETRQRVEQLPEEIALTLPPITVLGAENESVTFESAPR
jgi:L-ascorbate metabolism protein UlaG (beta-lactamase superfamily)